MDHHGRQLHGVRRPGGAASIGIAPARVSGSTCRPSRPALRCSGPTCSTATVNGRPLRGDRACPTRNRSRAPLMAPHGIYPAAGDDAWVAIACRDDDDWSALGRLIDEPWTGDARWVTRRRPRSPTQDDARRPARWLDAPARQVRRCRRALCDAGVPAAAVQTPPDGSTDPSTGGWGLWPESHHTEIGAVRVDGIPIHLSETDWQIDAGAPTPRPAQRRRASAACSA